MSEFSSRGFDNEDYIFIDWVDDEMDEFSWWFRQLGNK